MNKRVLLDNEVWLKIFHTVKGNSYNMLLFSYNTIFKNEVTIRVTDEEIIIKRANIDSAVSKKASQVNKNPNYFQIGVTVNKIIPKGIYYISYDNGDELVINIERTKEEYIKQLSNGQELYNKS